MQDTLSPTMKAGLHRIQGSTTSADFLKGTAQLRAGLTDSAEVIHAVHAGLGWWTDLHTELPLDRNVGELLMLVVSELAEVPAGQGKSVEMDDKLPDRLMFEVELADAAIRIFDMSGKVSQFFWTGYLYAMTVTPTTDMEMGNQDIDLMLIVRAVSNAMESHRKDRWLGVRMADGITMSIRGCDFYIGVALHGIFHLARRNAFDLPGAIYDKLLFNLNRADHKVENRKAPGGKAY